MRTVLTGSSLIKLVHSDFPREPKDFDQFIDTKVWGTDANTWSYELNGKRYEYLYCPVVFESDCFSDLNTLLTVKMSHLFWDIKWDKHMFDVQFLLKKGYRYDPELFAKLYDFWGTIHGPIRRSDLEMSAEEFFDNALKEFDHDSLHLLLADPPTYTKILVGEVEVSPVLWEGLSEAEKWSVVDEEVSVMGFERYRNLPYRQAYAKMLKKFIRFHAPMWQVPWIIENYISLHKKKDNFIKLIEGQLTDKNYQKR